MDKLTRLQQQLDRLNDQIDRGETYGADTEDMCAEVNELECKIAMAKGDLDDYESLCTPSGKFVNYKEPQAGNLTITDIATSLSRTCRFRGMTIRPYSVAEHCIRMAVYCWSNHGRMPSITLHCLLHDAAECLIGDIPTPLKRLLGGTIEPIEHGILESIYKGFNIPMPTEDEQCLVNQLDAAMLVTEKSELMPNTPVFRGYAGVEKLQMSIGAAMPGIAEEYKRMFNQLRRMM